jgi:hypothetical protein
MTFQDPQWTLDEAIHWAMWRSHDVGTDPLIAAYIGDDPRLTLDEAKEKLLSHLKRGEIRAISAGQHLAADALADASIVHHAGFTLAVPMFEGADPTDLFDRVRLLAEHVRACFPADRAAAGLRLVTSSGAITAATTGARPPSAEARAILAYVAEHPAHWTEISNRRLAEAAEQWVRATAERREEYPIGPLDEATVRRVKKRVADGALHLPQGAA